MKKFLLIISFMLLMVFGIVSCGKNEENNKPIDATKNEEQQIDDNNENVEQDNQEENEKEESKVEEKEVEYMPLKLFRKSKILAETYKIADEHYKQRGQKWKIS